MIIEVLDGRHGGVRTRVSVASVPLTIGRALDNDLILDDAYVDARHARIRVNDDGQYEIEDLGTINGLVRVGERHRSERISAGPGTQVRIGRTVLRFRDPAEQVPPALRDGGAEVSPFERVLASAWTRAAVCAAALALLGWQSWLGSYERGASQDVVLVLVGVAMIGGIWAGAWAIGSRVAIGRFNFVAHYTIFSVITLTAALLGVADAWGSFLFPDSRTWSALSVVVWLALFTGSIALHLTRSSSMNRMRRWRAAAVTSAIACALILVIEYSTREIYTDVPEFNAILKRAPARVIPQIEQDAFGDVVADLARRADEMTQD